MSSAFVPAHRFGERYQVMSADSEDNRALLSALPTLVSPDEVFSNKVTGEFR